MNSHVIKHQDGRNLAVAEGQGGMAVPLNPETLRTKPFDVWGWSIRYRGLLAIHASKTRAYPDRCNGEPAIGQALAAARCRFDTLFLGVVCTTRLVACWPTEQIVADDLPDAFSESGPGRFARYLHAIGPLDPPVLATGRSSLWGWSP